MIGAENLGGAKLGGLFGRNPDWHHPFLKMEANLVVFQVIKCNHFYLFDHFWMMPVSQIWPDFQ